MLLPSEISLKTIKQVAGPHTNPIGELASIYNNSRTVQHSITGEDEINEANENNRNNQLPLIGSNILNVKGLE